MQNDHYPKSLLIARGWSDQLIKKHLGSPDGVTEVVVEEEGYNYDPNDPDGYDYEPEYETVPAYSLARVREIEQSEQVAKDIKANRLYRQQQSVKNFKENRRLSYP